jgi:hypothetical protein
VTNVTFLVGDSHIVTTGGHDCCTFQWIVL